MKNKICWIVTEGLIGTENQCLGVAEALGVSPKVKRIALNWPWKTFSPFLGLECKSTFTPALEPPWPDLLIASGRKSIAASRYIKKMSAGKTFTVQIQDPRISPSGFDLVAVPAHDLVRGKNVIVTEASPNRITMKKLEEAKNHFSEFENFKKPRVAVLIGGNSKAHKLTQELTKKMAAQLHELSQTYSLMMTTSRRTGKDNEKILRKTLKDTDAYIWDGDGENPYFAMLAYADYILVTNDSASMLSDAVTTGKPVYMIPLDGGSQRFERLYAHLKYKGVLREFEGHLEHWSYEPLSDAKIVAQAIKAAICLVPRCDEVD